MAHEDAVSELTLTQLGDVIGQLRDLVDKLDAELAGGGEVWTGNDALAGHQLLVLASSHVNGVRALRAAATRRNTLVRLDDRR